jgi:SAM-dependent methyltransferase
MTQTIRVSDGVQRLMCCPACKTGLSRADDCFCCTNPECNARFPMVDGVPILINNNASLFQTDDFVLQRSTTFDLRRHPIKAAVHKLLPRLGRNIKGKRNYLELLKLLLSQAQNPRILTIGGRTLGDGMQPLVAEPRIELVETDVSFGPRTQLICDAHEIPFANGGFDAVIVQAVLPYLLEPAKCVDEIHRVLKPNGVIYAESAFMQQAVLGCYDFVRFTYLGHRRLFRRFQEIDSGVVGGPGMALAWTTQFFLLSFAKSKSVRGLIRALCRLTLSWIKYFDYYLADKPGAYDSASGFYFIGRKSEDVLSDRSLVSFYRGATGSRVQ